MIRVPPTSRSASTGSWARRGSALSGPSDAVPVTPEAIGRRRRLVWPLALAREFDDAMLHLRFNEPELGTWVLQTKGDLSAVLAAEDVLRGARRALAPPGDPLFWRRTLKRLDLSARTLVALITPGSSATPALWPSWPWPPTGRTCSTAPSRTPTTTSPRPSWC